MKSKDLAIGAAIVGGLLILPKLLKGQNNLGPVSPGSYAQPKVTVTWEGQQRRALMRATSQFLVNSTAKATISISNPNPVPLDVLLNLIVGSTRQLGAPLSIPAKVGTTDGKASQSISIVMPDKAGSYEATLDVTWSGGGYSGTPYLLALGFVTVFALQQPGVSVTWG